MMNAVFAGLILTAVVWGVAAGRTDALAAALLGSGRNAVELMLTVTGGMALWSGLLEVGSRAGLTEGVSRLLRPLLRRLLPGMRPGGEAEKYVCLNIVSNLLGLGNAATPLGLRAMRALGEERRLRPGEASREMMTFAVINTASVQLLPTTLLTLRAEAGAAAPGDILPCVWATSACALAAGMIVCRCAGRGKWKGESGKKARSADQRAKRARDPGSHCSQAGQGQHPCGGVEQRPTRAAAPPGPRAPGYPKG